MYNINITIHYDMALYFYYFVHVCSQYLPDHITVKNVVVFCYIHTCKYSMFIHIYMIIILGVNVLMAGICIRHSTIVYMSVIGVMYVSCV